MTDCRPMMRRPLHRRQTWLALATALLIVAGCTREEIIEKYDSARARRTLVAALDAWQAGQAKNLQARRPPLRFVDDDWLAGKQLIGYELADPAAEIRPYCNVPVHLELREKDGRTTRRAVVYQVIIEPREAVLRSD